MRSRVQCRWRLKSARLAIAAAPEKICNTLPHLRMYCSFMARTNQRLLYLAVSLEGSIAHPHGVCLKHSTVVVVAHRGAEIVSTGVEMKLRVEECPANLTLACLPYSRVAPQAGPSASLLPLTLPWRLNLPPPSSHARISLLGALRG